MMNTMLHRLASVVGVFLAAMGLSLATAPIASADSGIRVVYTDDDGSNEGDCAGQWLSGPNEFRLQDRDLNDDDWCYIDYRFEGQDNSERFSIPQDEHGRWVPEHVRNPNALPRIEFKVCQERQDDPDICLSWRTYRT